MKRSRLAGLSDIFFREQEFFLRAIREDLDLTAHLQAALDSLRIVLAADRSAREGQTVKL